MAKKKAKKEKVKKANAAKKKATPDELFSEWWEKKADKLVTKIEKAWIKSNKPNDEDDEPGGDHWHVNNMMHSGDAHEMTYDIAEKVFLVGFSGDKWEPSMGDSLFCDLDMVIEAAYLAGKEMVT